MASIFGKKDSIECKTALVVALKIVNSGRALNHYIIGKCIKYNCTRNGLAQIKRELDPPVSLFKNPSAKLSIGDTIEGEEFYVLVRGLKAEPDEFHGNFSGRHNCRSFTSNSDYTYAEISMPFPGKEIIVVKLPENFISPIEELTKKKVNPATEASPPKDVPFADE